MATEQQHIHEIQNVANDEVKDAHVACLRYCTDKELKVTVDLTEMFQYPYAKGDFEMGAIVGISEDVCRKWVGVDEDESSREPVGAIISGAPQFLRFGTE